MDASLNQAARSFAKTLSQQFVAALSQAAEQSVTQTNECRERLQFARKALVDAHESIGHALRVLDSKLTPSRYHDAVRRMKKARRARKQHQQSQK